jgi:hypothetical protein
VSDVNTTEYDEDVQRAVRHLREFVHKRVRARQRNDRTDQGHLSESDLHVVAAYVDSLDPGDPEHNVPADPKRRELTALLRSAERNNY